MEERRKTHRDRTYLGGQIAFDDRCCIADCLVRNLSPGGAKIVFSVSATIPDEFDLAIPRKAAAAGRASSGGGKPRPASRSCPPPLAQSSRWSRRERSDGSRRNAKRWSDASPKSASRHAEVGLATAIDRLFVIAVIVVLANLYFRSSCGVEPAFVGQFNRLSGFDQALPRARSSQLTIAEPPALH